jgi:hypothetical protein
VYEFLLQFAAISWNTCSQNLTRIERVACGGEWIFAILQSADELAGHIVSMQGT